RDRCLQLVDPVWIVEDEPILAAVLGGRLRVRHAGRGPNLEIRHRDADHADDALDDGARIRTALGARNLARNASGWRERAPAQSMLAPRLARCELRPRK